MIHSPARATLALVAVLAACGDTGSQSGANAQATGAAANAQQAGPDDVQNRVAAMPEAQRNGVFIRAIRDARQDCQHVESSRRAGENGGFPVWTATCDGGRTFSIVIMNDGSAAVLNAQGG
jgi:hypothetical protein